MGELIGIRGITVKFNTVIYLSLCKRELNGVREITVKFDKVIYLLL